MTTLLNCFFGGRRQTSDLFEKLPIEIITIILNYVKPEYVFIEKYSTTKIKNDKTFEFNLQIYQRYKIATKIIFIPLKN